MSSSFLNNLTKEYHCSSFSLSILVPVTGCQSADELSGSISKNLGNCFSVPPSCTKASNLRSPFSSQIFFFLVRICTKNAPWYIFAKLTELDPVQSRAGSTAPPNSDL